MPVRPHAPLYARAQGTANVTFTPTASVASTKITVQGQAVVSGQPSAGVAVPTDGSAASVSIVDTSADGSAKETYSIKALPRPRQFFGGCGGGWGETRV